MGSTQIKEKPSQTTTPRKSLEPCNWDAHKAGVDSSMRGGCIKKAASRRRAASFLQASHSQTKGCPMHTGNPPDNGNFTLTGLSLQNGGFVQFGRSRESCGPEWAKHPQEMDRPMPLRYSHETGGSEQTSKRRRSDVTCRQPTRGNQAVP